MWESVVPLQYPNGPAKFPLGPAKFADEETPIEPATASTVSEPSSSSTDNPSKDGDSLDCSLTAIDRKTRNKWTDEEPLPLAQENLHYEKFSAPEFLRLVAPAPTIWRLPLQSYRPPTETFASLEIPWDDIESNICSILRTFDFTCTLVELKHRRPTEDPTEFNELTILVIMHTVYHSRDWRSALGQIRKYLKDTGKPVVSSLPVEMVTAVTQGSWIHCALKFDSPLGRLWNDNLRSGIGDIVRGMPWRHIDVSNMSYIYPNGEESEEKPTVCIIGVLAIWDSRWPMCEARIGRLFESHGYGDIIVQVRQGGFWP